MATIYGLSYSCYNSNVHFTSITYISPTNWWTICQLRPFVGAHVFNEYVFSNIHLAVLCTYIIMWVALTITQRLQYKLWYLRATSSDNVTFRKIRFEYYGLLFWSGSACNGSIAHSTHFAHGNRGGVGGAVAIINQIMQVCQLPVLEDRWLCMHYSRYVYQNHYCIVCFFLLSLV